MNKFLQKLAKIFLGLSMAAGVGVAIGSNKKASSAGAISSLSDLTLVTSSSTLDTSKKYVYATGNTGTPTFLTNGTGSSSSYGGYTTNLADATEWSIGGNATTSSFYLTDGTYYVSALTSNSYSRLTSAPGSNNQSAVNSSGNLIHSTTTARNLRFVSGSGWRWYASTNGAAGYLYEVASGPAADVVLSKDNNPFSSTSGSNTSTATKTLSGIEYQNYGGYLYSSTYLSINRSINGYIGNNTAYSKNIDKIVVNYNSGGSTYFTMYKGASALAETTTVTPKSTGTGAITYDMGDSSQYFKLKLTTTGTYCNINSISIYLGSDPSYTVTKNGTNCTISGASTVDGSQVEDFTITPSTNYDAPQTITVTAGDSTLVQNTNYSYYVADYVGYLQLYKNGQTANVTITAVGVAQLTITDSVTNGSLSSTSRIHSGEALDITIVPAAGHTYPTSVTVTMGGSTVAAQYDSSDGTLYYTPVTGNIVVTATCPASGNEYSITTTVTNGTYSGDTSITDNGGVASVTVSPTGDYKLPTTVSVSGASHTYDSTTGVISLSNATGNVTISATMVPFTEYSITVNETNGSHTGSSTIKENRTASLTFTPASGYGQPSSVTVSGATSSWTRGTGVLSLSNPTGNVTVTYTAVGNELDSISISTNSGSYTLGDNFVMPTVTAKYTVNADADVTSSASYSGYDPYTTGNQNVTISYTEGGITKTQSYTANVSAASVQTTTYYQKCTSMSDIVDGGKYVLIGYKEATTTYYAMPSYSSGNNIQGATVTLTENETRLTEANMSTAAVYTLTSTGTTNQYYIGDGSQYLYAAGSGTSNHLKGKASTDSSAGAFTISYSTFFSVVAASSNRNTMRFNDSNNPPIFSCYANNTNQTEIMFFKEVKEQTGSADLIRITATYKGGEKYVGDSISTSDFTVKKQLNTGNQLIDVASGYTISAHTLTAESNSITVSYTEGNITKTAVVVVPATPRAVTLVSVELVQGENVVKEYVDWSGAEWDFTDLSVRRTWSDASTESFNLADLVESEDASVSPAKPAVGVTSFTVSYEYLSVSITNASVTGISVVADYVESVSWGGKSLSHFKAFSGGQLTSTTVSGWTVKATYAGAGETNALSFGTGANQFTIRIGDSKVVNSLPYTWTTADDNQFVYVVVGGVAKGDSTYAKTNICATINAIDHSETITGDIEMTAELTKDEAIAIHTASGVGGSAGVAVDHDIDENIHITGDKGSHESSTPLFWKDGVRVYAGNTLTISPMNGAVITSISLTSSNATCSAASGSSPWTIASGGDDDIVITIATKTTPITSSIVVEYTIEGSQTTTVHYANDMNHFDAQKKVVEFAKFMNTTMNGSNVCSGTFANLESAWDDVADKYDELFGASTTLNSTELAWAKKMLQYANAIWGSEAEAACVEKAMKTYEFCVNKYDLDPFMDGVRSVSAQQSSPLINIVGEKANSVAIIVIISMVSVTAIGGYFFLRKRKENI